MPPPWPRGSLLASGGGIAPPRRRRSSPTGWSLPVVLLLLGLVAYPFFYAIYVSFTNRVVGNDGEWIGLANFRYLARSAGVHERDLEHDRAGRGQRYPQARDRAGPGAARQPALPGRGLFRSFLMLPWAMPAFVAFLTWRVLYQPIGGGINLSSPDGHLSRDRRLARPALHGDARGHRRRRSGAAFRSGSSASWPRCRRSRQSSTRPRASTARRRGSASAT